jgi:hypothetical protein
MTKAQAVRTKDGRTFYLRRSEDMVSQAIDNQIVAYHVPYIINAATLQLASPGIDLKAGDLQSSVGPAPHVAMASAVLQEIKDSRGPGWETLYLRLAEKVRGSDAVDPILRAILVKEFLSYACECAPFKAEEIRRQLKNFDGLDLDVAWMNPADADANACRPKAEAALEAVGSLDGLIKQIDQWLADLSTTIQVYRPVCIFFNDNSGVRLPQISIQGPIHILDCKAGQVPHFLKVGEIKSAKLILDPRLSADVPQGCLLFFKGL